MRTYLVPTASTLTNNTIKIPLKYFAAGDFNIRIFIFRAQKYRYANSFDAENLQRTAIFFMADYNILIHCSKSAIQLFRSFKSHHMSSLATHYSKLNLQNSKVLAYINFICKNLHAIKCYRLQSRLHKL